MLLSELCPCLARRLARYSPLLCRVSVSRSPPTSRLSSAILSMTTDDADEVRDSSDRSQQPGVLYVEPSRSRRVFVERFLRRELGLSWARAEREVVRCHHLGSAGLPLMRENLAFLTEQGVQRQHLQEDVDLLGVAHSDLLRVHSLVSSLPDADYCQYYPLSRARPDTVEELFSRLLIRRSNLVHQLSDILKLPELTVSRAVSRMALQITKSSNNKLLGNAKLLIDLGVPPAELSRSLYLLRLAGSRLRHREQQCRSHGIPVLARYLGMSDTSFQKRVTQGGRLSEQTSDVETVVADRLGATREQVAQQTRRSDILQRLTPARLEAVTSILERAGYSAAERVSALQTVYHSRPERLQQRLELCRRLGRPHPSLALLFIDQHRFERRVRKWGRKAALQGSDAAAVVISGDPTVGEVGSDPETEEGSDVDKAGDETRESGGEMRNGCGSEGELEDMEGRMLVKGDLEREEAASDVGEGMEVGDDSREVCDRLVHAPESKGVEGEVQTEVETKHRVNYISEIEEKEDCEGLEDDPEYINGDDILKEEKRVKRDLLKKF